MKRLPTFLLSAAFLSTGPVAAVCPIDVAPATFLVLPYFEQDLKRIDKPRKTETTTLRILNPGTAQAVAEVRVFTDMSFEVIRWRIPLRGRSWVEVPIHEIFRGDIESLPGLESIDTVVPSDASIEGVISAMTGEDLGGGCLTIPRGDRVVRGWIQIAETSGEGILAGTVVYRDKRRKTLSVEPLVHFDNGEGLPVSWAIDFDLTGGAATEVIVWRFGGFNRPDPVGLCDDTRPNGWYPLGQDDAQVSAADGVREDILVAPDGSSIPGFPYSAGRYELGRGDLALPIPKGTLYVQLMTPSWVTVRHSARKQQGQVQAIPIEPGQCADSSARRSR